MRLREAGEHRVALAAARRALGLFRRHEGRAHPDVATALLEVGAALELHDRWAEALRQYEEAERSSEHPRVRGESRPFRSRLTDGLFTTRARRAAGL